MKSCLISHELTESINVSVTSFDHVAIPTMKPRELIEFYGCLGFDLPDLDSLDKRRAPAFEIRFGSQKINVHLPVLWQRQDFDLRRHTARPGCGDICFVWEGSEDDLRSRLTEANTEVLIGPVAMLGAQGAAASIYVRDPDGNLLEFMFYDPEMLTSDVAERLPL